MNARASLLMPALLAFSFFTSHAADEFRAWTNANGRKVEAAFAGQVGDNVKLKLRTGAVVPVGSFHSWLCRCCMCSACLGFL